MNGPALAAEESKGLAIGEHVDHPQTETVFEPGDATHPEGPYGVDVDMKLQTGQELCGRCRGRLLQSRKQFQKPGSRPDDYRWAALNQTPCGLGSGAQRRR